MRSPFLFVATLFLAGSLSCKAGPPVSEEPTPADSAANEKEAKIVKKKAEEKTPKEETPTTKATDIKIDFEDVTPGALPDGWRADATNLKPPIVPIWKVVEDKSAPSGAKILSLIDPNHHSGGVFNLCWTDTLSFQDGELEVRFKARKGEIDQGGGIIWRAQNNENYYIARFNPLEDNFRIYTVENRSRHMLKSANVKLDPSQWHHMKIVQKGNHYEAFLDGKKYLEGDDTLFPNAGGVGLWTKADAVTSFDDFVVHHK